ncbi:hypothetical protein KUTeg_001728 [Tegillarca granosa]|uniref:Peptidase C1A papain C-terminal domain-containing protein n=1 Tax=Tegillarca granosa TaxID=220873 RepID=A0ABQ9FVG1_TEGGR|nr:hypothetical protein KUTeg_001728 [Tegillarca granosa]
MFHYSAIGNIEGQWMKMGHADCGVFGGWPYLAYQYIQKTGGLQTWEDYWYCCGLGGAKGTCEVCPAPGYNTSLCGPSIPYCNMTQSCVTKLDKKKFVSGLNVVGWKAIDQNETVIASQLMELGPLSVALDATLLQFYHHGVFEPFLCNPKNLDHAVLLVGFGQEKELFETKYYWKVKNSWGHKWGEKGYFRIKRGAGMCGINTQVTTSVLQKT